MEKVESEKVEKQFADWVNSTNDKIIQRRKLDVVSQYRQMHRKTIEERRERLAALLAAEQEEYFRALDDMVETQDQRRQRLATCALELKQQREARRKELASTKLAQAFRQNCDELRGATSRQAVLQVSADRQEQLHWQAARKHEQQEDDRIFDEMWEQERLKKVQRAKDDLERTNNMNKQLRAQLQAQQAAYDAVKEREAALRVEEDRLFREQVKHEAQVEAQHERERLAAAHAAGRATREYNSTLRAAKAAKERQAREDDCKELAAILLKIKEEDELDHKMKQQRREEMARYTDALREHMNQEAQNEVELEKLWQQETEKAWAKREAGWMAEQKARERLLEQVFEERAKQLAQQYVKLREEKYAQAADKERLLQEMEAAAKVDSEQAALRKEEMVGRRMELAQQVEEKLYFRDHTKKEKLLEKASNELAEQEYRRRVQAELDAVEAKCPPQYRSLRSGARSS